MATGWLARAARLLDGEDRCVERGWLAQRLAEVLAAAGRNGAAAAELEHAAARFRGLGCEERAAAAEARATRGTEAPLTPREIDMLRLVADGLSDDEIAARLVLSPHTVHRYVANIRMKLGQGSRTAAAGHVAREGLI